MRDYWQVWPGALDDEICDKIITTSLKYEPKIAGIGFDEDHKIDDNYRSSKIRWINTYEYFISALILYFAKEANRSALDMDIYDYVTELQFTEYTEEYKGKYNIHHDVNWLQDPISERKLSVVIQLSKPEDYEGGRFSFASIPNPLDNQFLPRGSVLVFPSFFEHSVSEVTKGTRYSLVSWLQGPKIR